MLYQQQTYLNGDNLYTLTSKPVNQLATLLPNILNRQNFFNFSRSGQSLCMSDTDLVR